ncbi:VanZ family protein [Rhizobium sullae]|uniref:VanZ like protein n=1 Tax=Rhizobium sullae TaxID=50338 RepID=A0A4R3PTM5_RHISU|nr:VanZ family protein [Rhizobium sullae]TCU06831.1 VanZ like protein [Rhizobium sullae]
MALRSFRVFAWVVFAAIVFVTVAPVDMRPHVAHSADLDRAMAFVLMAFVFIVAFPRHWVFSALLVVSGAGAIELLQYLSGTRHARVEDAAVKAFGATVGIILGCSINQLKLILLKTLGRGDDLTD